MVHIYSKDNNLTLELFCSSTLSCESLLIISVIVEQHHRYFRSHITFPKSHLWNPKSSSWLQYQQEAGCFHSQVSSYLSFRHCSELNPPPFSLTSFSLPPFFFCFLCPVRCMLLTLRHQEIMESLVSGLYFLPRLLWLCIIVAEEEEEGRLCATDSNEGCLFIF